MDHLVKGGMSQLRRFIRFFSGNNRVLPRTGGNGKESGKCRYAWQKYRHGIAWKTALFSSTGFRDAIGYPGKADHLALSYIPGCICILMLLHTEIGTTYSFLNGQKVK